MRRQWQNTCARFGHGIRKNIEDATGSPRARIFRGVANRAKLVAYMIYTAINRTPSRTILSMWHSSKPCGNVNKTDHYELGIDSEQTRTRAHALTHTHKQTRTQANADTRTHPNAHTRMRTHARTLSDGELAQKVVERPSTAMLAPCATASATLLATTPAFSATFSTPASEPLWLKQYCPARPNFNCPGTKTKTSTRCLSQHSPSWLPHRCPAFPKCYFRHQL